MTVVPWLGIHTANFNADQLPSFLKFSFSITGLCLVVVGIISFRYSVKRPSSEFDSIKCSITCIDDRKRNLFISKLHPDLYLPLEENFLNLANNPACDINVFPHINSRGDFIEKPEFVKRFGYRFNGKNMISVQMKEYLPYERQSRTFIFAINPTEKPSEEPMFFFSYGQRYKHNYNDGVSNHDKSFGSFYGEPKPNDPIPEKYRGKGVRIFFYCEHSKEDRTSSQCDTESVCDIDINEWSIFVISYNGEKLKLYKNGNILYCQNIRLKTSKSLIINIGGFVHHNESGAIIARDLDYSMNGFIREFIMTRRCLNDREAEEVTADIKNILEYSS